MSFRYFKFGGVECITFLRDDDFYLLDQNTKTSYREEKVFNYKMEQRVRKLNKRINFTIEAVREALYDSQPVDAELFLEQEYDESTETDAVLRLKYRLKDAPAPLKWEWHMSGIDNATFYCALMLLQLGHTICLGNLQENLVGVVELKEREIQQYRNEGAVLRRTTVATKPFDGSAYFKQYKSLLDNWRAYTQFVQSSRDFSGAMVKYPPFPMVSNGANVKVEDGPMDTGALTTLSPRNRKRKALEADQQHVERMALQRRRISKLEYKNSESQEDELKPDNDFAAPQTMLDYNDQEASATVSDGKESSDESYATTESESGENRQGDNKEASATVSKGKESSDESYATTESESGENRQGDNKEASATVSDGKGSTDESYATTESESGGNGQDDKEASATVSDGKGSTDESYESSTESESAENGRDNSLSNIRLHVTGDSEDKEDNDDNESKDESKDKKDEQVDGGTKKAEGSSSSGSSSPGSSSSGSSSSSLEDKEKNKVKDEDSDSKAKGDGKPKDKSEKDGNATMSTSETDANNKENAEE